MKRILVAGVAILALAGPAFAQATVTTGVAPSGETVVIAPENRAMIKKYVIEKKVKPITVKERVTVGATLPADVELMAVPGDWGPDLGRYRYVYHDNHVVFVEPSSRRVVSVID
jgi:Protein of unknown function (DUF1236)